MKNYQVGLLFLSLTGCFVNNAFADSRTSQISLPLSVEYDSNPNMARDKESVVRYTAIPRYATTLTSGLNQFSANFGLRLQRSSNTRVSADREDPSVGLAWLREYELGTYGIRLNYDEDTTRTTERLTSGLVNQDSTRRSKAASAHWSRSITERLSIDVNGNYQKTQYSGSGLTGFADKSISSRLTYLWNSRVSPFVQVAYSHYTPDGAVSNSNSKNFIAGVQYKQTENLDWTAKIGLNRTSSIGTGTLGGVEANYQMENKSLSLGYERSVFASGIGDFQESDSIRAAYKQQLSSVDELGADFSLNENKSGNAVKFKQLSAWYARDLSQFWSFRGYVSHRVQEGNGDSTDADVLGITFTYNDFNF